MTPHESTSDDRAYRVEALAKGLRILALFSDRRPALRLTEIVALSGLPMPTAFRLVATLAGEGFLERLPGGAVRPGTAVLTLGFAALHGLDLVQTSAAILRDLAGETRQTVNLGVLSDDEVLYLVRLYGNALVTANVTVGSRLPAIVTSMGKVLLAALPDDELGEHVDESSFKGTWGPNAVASMKALRKQLARVRADGYAVADEELARGLRSIAAPVRQANGEVVAAVNIAVAAAEFTVTRLVKTLRDPLLRACAHASLRLGAQG